MPETSGRTPTAAPAAAHTAHRLTTVDAAIDAANAVLPSTGESVHAVDAIAIAGRVDLLAVIDWRDAGWPAGIPRSTAHWLTTRLALRRRPRVWAALWDANPDPRARFAMLREAMSWGTTQGEAVYLSIPENHVAVRDFLLALDEPAWESVGPGVMNALGWQCLWDRTPAMATALWRYLDFRARHARIAGRAYMMGIYELLEGYFESAPHLLRADEVGRILQHVDAETRAWALTRWVPQLPVDAPSAGPPDAAVVPVASARPSPSARAEAESRRTQPRRAARRVE